MYDKINITENTLQILSLFTNNFKREYYIREVEKILKISPRTSQTILESLENKGIIESKKRGKIKLYKIKISEFTKRYLVFVEEYKTIAFLENKLLIKEIIEKITPHIDGIGLIFGSYVKGIEKKDSDLDIFIIGNYDKKKVNKISKIYGIKISIKFYPIKTFEENINKDILIEEILKNHIIFTGTKRFIKEVFKNG
jgi:uncharacterized protein